VTDALTGKPIQGVPVTDGYTYTVTDYSGRYALQGNSNARSVYITVPAEYEIPTDGNNHPAYYKNGNFGDTSQKHINDFQLTPRSSVSDKFTLAVAADIHVSSDSDLSKFSGRSLPDMISTLDSYCTGDYSDCITILAGDQMTDNMSMMQPFKNALAGKTVGGRRHTFLHCIGNHDFDAQYFNSYTGSFSDNIARTYVAEKTFVDNFGPTDYSLNIGKAHIVVMNNMKVTGAGSNSVNITFAFSNPQVEWLKADLDLVENPQDKVVIFCVHVPIMGYETYTNFTNVLNELKRFHEVHVVSGHSHWLRNHEHMVTAAGGSRIYEHNLQMMGGMWWNTNLSVDGSPAGYGLIKFNGKQLYESVNKTVGADMDHQLRVYDGNATYNSWSGNAGGSSLHYSGSYNWGDALKGKFIARVWNADADNWTVEFVKDGVSYPMTRLSGQLDQCTFGYSWMFHDCPGGGSNAYKLNSDNYWVIDAPSGNPANETDWKIVATHRPSASRTLVYERNVLQTDFSGFAYGASFPANN